jgi:hypothetical protein
MDIFNLLFQANTTQLATAQQKVQQLGQSAQQAQGSATGLSGALGSVGQAGGLVGEAVKMVENLTTGLAAAGRAAVALPGLLFAAVGAAGVLAAIRFAGPLDDLGDLAEKFGLSATQALILKQSLEAGGTSIDAYYAGLQKIAVSLARGDEGSTKAATAMKTLGLNVSESTGPLEIATQLSEKYGDKLKQNKISADEMAALQIVLGKNYREVMVALDGAATAQERLNSFTAAGVGISVDGAKAASDMEAANNDLNVVFQAVGSQLVAKIVPAFSNLINQLVDSYKNGGLVAVAFNTIQFAANAVMVPIRVLINLFIALDTVVTSVGKTIGAVFAALATRSMEPLKALKDDVAKLFAEADAKVKAVGLWGTDSGQVQAAKTLQLTGADDKPPKPTKSPKAKSDREPRDSSIASALKQEQDALLRTQVAWNGLFEVQEHANESFVRAAIARGDFDAKVDASGKVIQKAATEQQKAALLTTAIERDFYEAATKREKAERALWDQSQKLVDQENTKVTVMRQSNAEHRIQLEVMSRFGATQDDVNLAITDYNIAQAEMSLAIAKARGDTAQEIVVLKEKVKTLREIKGLQVDRKDDTTKAAATDSLDAKLGPLTSPYEKQMENLNNWGAKLDEWRANDIIKEQEYAARKAQIAQQEQELKLNVASGFFGNLASLTQSGNKKLAKIGKAAAIAQATIDGILGVQKALASAPPPFNFALAAAVGVAAAVNVSKIASSGYKSGGYTGNGGVSDVAGVVHGQEFVVNARATAKNRPLLDAINDGVAPLRAAGPASTSSPVGGTVQNISISVNVQGGDTSAETAQAAAKAVRDAARQVFAEEDAKRTRRQAYTV